MCIHFGTEYRHQKTLHPRQLNLPAAVGMQKRNNPVSPATAISDLADTVELSYHEIRALQRFQYIWQVASGKSTYTIAMDIHPQHG
jgi:hypothetical protein